MKKTNFGNVPVGVLLIAAFYIFGAFMLLAGAFINPVGASQTIAIVHGLSPSIGVEILPAVAALALVLAYGLLRLSRWGFYLMMAYLLYMVFVNLIQGGLNFVLISQADMQRAFGNLLWSALVMIYLLIERRRFVK
jgi:uncharacterized membrane protein